MQTDALLLELVDVDDLASRPHPAGGAAKASGQGRGAGTARGADRGPAAGEQRSPSSGPSPFGPGHPLLAACQLDAGAVVTIEFDVRAGPGSRRAGIPGIRDGALIVKVNSRAVQGQANRAVTALIAHALGVRTADVRIVAGDRNRCKRIRVTGAVGALVGSLESLHHAGLNGAGPGAAGLGARE